MKFTLALCVTVLVACYHSAAAGGPTSPPRPRPNQPARSRSTPGSPRRGPRQNLPVTAQNDLPEEPIPLPVDAIKQLGKYGPNDIAKAQKRFDHIDSAKLEAGLINTNLFTEIRAKAQKNLRKYPKWTKEQREAYMRQKVAGQLNVIENTYGKDAAERLLIRAMLDKGF